MPTSPSKPCAHPGCGALVQQGNRCAVHVADQRRTEDAHRASNSDTELSAKIRNGLQWRKLRVLLMQQNPICCDPHGFHSGAGELTTSIHHIQGLAVAPHLAYDQSNTAPLCIRCHNTVEAMERQGRSTAHLFEGKQCKLSFGFA